MESIDDVIENSWLIRPCDMYKEEHSDCKSMKARFHQHFIHGESVDCSQWKTDFDNCIKWQNDGDINAVRALIESEKKRRLDRLETHYKNNTWKKRQSPPTDWNKPLPEWLEKEYKDSYLHHKSQEMKGENYKPNHVERTLCVIS